MLVEGKPQLEVDVLLEPHYLLPNVLLPHSQAYLLLPACLQQLLQSFLELLYVPFKPR